jgi:hypothetical protein
MVFKVAINDEHDSLFYSYLLLIQTGDHYNSFLIECEKTTSSEDPDSTDFKLNSVKPFGEFNSSEIPNGWELLSDNWADYVLPLCAVNKILELVEFESDNSTLTEN